MHAVDGVLQIRWTRERAALFAVVGLVIGIGSGWAIRGAITSSTTSPAAHSSVPAQQHASATAPAAGADRLKSEADAQAAPLLVQLESSPADPGLLIGIGNVYYDAQKYATAVDYYGRALAAKPSDAGVRTDMGTAYWYLGDADRAIAEFDKALTYVPNNPNTLFNRGLVKWQGKHDAAGAIADWNRLLQTNPNYDQRDKVIQLLRDVEKQAAPTPGV